MYKKILRANFEKKLHFATTLYFKLFLFEKKKGGGETEHLLPAILADPVTEDINNNPITPDLYIVYYNGHNADVDYGFYFLASTTELSYNHVNVGIFSQFMLYQVKAYVDVDNALLSQIEDLVAQRHKVSMKEVESLLKGERRR